MDGWMDGNKQQRQRKYALFMTVLCFALAVLVAPEMDDGYLLSFLDPRVRHLAVVTFFQHMEKSVTRRHDGWHLWDDSSRFFDGWAIAPIRVFNRVPVSSSHVGI
jgi:hypothetical protein